MEQPHSPTLVHIVSRPGCDYCVQAKDFLEERRVPFSLESLDPADSVAYARRRDELVETTKARTFPFIFLEGVFIGGFQGLVHAYETGRLSEVCRKAGVTIREVEF